MKIRIIAVYLSIVLIISLAGIMDASLSASDETWKQENQAKLTEIEKTGVSAKMVTMQIPFIANQGQVDEQVQFYAKTFGGTVFVTKEGRIVYSLSKMEDEQTISGVALHEELIGATMQAVTGEHEAVSRVSYFKGKNPSAWQNNIPTYQYVNFGEVYPDIELKLKAYSKNVEKLFYVQPGANPQNIRVRLSGAKGLTTNAAGELEIETELGLVKFTKPVAYQKVGDIRQEVEVTYLVEGNEYGFYVGKYERGKKLIIDPLLASTFVGGSSNEEAYAIAIDESDNMYVTGWTESSDFPTTLGALDTTYNGELHTYGGDAFVFKLNAYGTMLEYATFIGGTDGQYGDVGYDIAIDEQGNAYVTGFTGSSDFPVTPGAYNTSNGIYQYDAFVLKLNPSGTVLEYSTFIAGGGGGYTCGRGIVVDEEHNAYVAGYTGYLGSYFPTTLCAYDTSLNGGYDVFVLVLNASGNKLSYSTLVGGADNDFATDIAIDSTGNAYVTGYSGYTASSDFPTTSGAYDTSYNGGQDVIVFKLDPSGSNLLYSTFIGGSSCSPYCEAGNSIDIDAQGNAYVTGYTKSSDFPTTVGAYNTTLGDGNTVFVLKLNTTGSNLEYSTFIEPGEGKAVRVDENHNVYVTGQGAGDVCVSKLNASGSGLKSSTLFGGSDFEIGFAIALNENNEVYIAGNTLSSDFPTTIGAYDDSYNGGGGSITEGGDVFVAALSLPGPCQVTSENDSWAGSLRQVLANAGSNGCTTITFASGVSTITLSSQLEITSGTLTIDGGASGVTISGNNSTRVFSVGSGANVTFENLTITQGLATGAACPEGCGGGILTDGTVTIGGNTIISGNTADTLSNGGGGGILNYQGALTIESGAIITSNTTGGGGGGLYNQEGFITINSGVTIDNNTADNDGGGIYNNGGTVTIASGSTINNNSALSNTGGGGGGIRNTNGGTVTIASGATVSGNTSTYSGGGIYNLEEGIVTVNGTISNNTASASGGGIYNTNNGVATIASGAVVNIKTANESGGGIRNNGGTLTIKSGATISGNIAVTGSGGGIRNKGATATLTIESGATVNNNTAGTNGGGIRNDDGITTIASSATVSNNMADYGGGIFNNNGTVSVNGTISGNTATNNGGGIDNIENGVVTVNGTVNGNTAGADGGGIHNVQNGVVSVNGTISGNTANNTGGGIFNVDNGSIIFGSGNLVQSNTATTDGGGIYNALNGILSGSTPNYGSGNTPNNCAGPGGCTLRNSYLLWTK